MKSSRWWAFWVVVLLPATGALAQEGGSLSDRIPSVSRKLHVKDGRMELTLFPLTSISLNDAFYQKLGGGLGIGYHLNEFFSLQLAATYSLNLENSNASAYTIAPGQNSVIPYAGKRTLLVNADLDWAPVYGKVSLASEWIMHFDTYLCAGFAAIGGEQVKGSSFAFGMDVGLGFRLFFSRSIALKCELKDVIVFTDKVSYGEVSRSDVQNQLLFNLGLSFMFLEGSRED
jgi:outer membrane beta-barrel protein